MKIFERPSILLHLPRFQGENLEHYEKLYEQICQMAAKKGCTPSQLALAWVRHQGDDVCPIPGTTKIENFNQNMGALSIKLTSEDMEELESIASAQCRVIGTVRVQELAKIQKLHPFQHGRLHK